MTHPFCNHEYLSTIPQEGLGRHRSAKGHLITPLAHYGDSIPDTTLPVQFIFTLVFGQPVFKGCCGEKEPKLRP